MKTRRVLINYNWLKSFILTLLLASLAGFTNAQVRITGKIVDSATQLPLNAAGVYIANSTIGTKTSEDGNFSFTGLSPGNYQLIVSRLGYQAKQLTFTPNPGDNTINIALTVKPIQLNEVTITSTDDWKRNLNLFKSDFIGTVKSQECRILNPEILNINFDYKANRLTASTDDFLEIENSSLGYKLRFLVKDFWTDYNSRKCHYAGSVIFEEMIGSKSDQKKWTKNRQDVYNGSFRHFLASLYMGKLDDEKFLVIPLIRTPNTARPGDSLINAKIKFFTTKMRNEHNLVYGTGDSIRKWSALKKLPRFNEKLGDTRLRETDMVKDITTPESYPLQFPGYIYVIYKNKHIDMDYEELIRFKGPAWDYPISALSLKDATQPTLFNSKGLLLTNESLYYEGAWNNRMLSLLPFDYTPPGK